MFKKNHKKHRFTLLELAVAMSVFSILMLILMQIFGSTHTVWRSSSAKADVYESARTTLNLLSRSLENALYSTEGKHFYLSNDTNGNAVGLWFPSTATFTTSSNTAMQFFYKLTASNDLFDLKFAYLSEHSANFRTEQEPFTNLPSNQYSILNNIAEFKIVPMKKTKVRKDDGSIQSTLEIFSPSAGYLDNLPDVVVIMLKVVDDDTKAINAADKTPYTHEFRRIVYINANQSI